MSTALRIGIIIGSTRPGRVGDQIAHWYQKQAAELAPEVEFVVVDLAEQALPLLDEPAPASSGQYSHEHTKRWSALIDGLDGFVVVTPEYNHAPSPSLLNAFSFLAREWHNKAGAIVSYGFSAGGARAAEVLRGVLGELNIADVRQHVLFSLQADFENFSSFAPSEYQLPGVAAQVEEVVAWATALREVRARKNLS